MVAAAEVEEAAEAPDVVVVAAPVPLAADEVAVAIAESAESALKTATTFVALVHVEGTEVEGPATKFTAAH